MAEILMTGSSGFLGRALLIALESRGHAVTCLTREMVDLSEPGASLNIPRKSYDVILHLATWTRAGRFCREFPGDQWLVNDQINLNMLKFWKEFCLSSKFIGFGTSAVYNSDGLLLREIDYLNSEPVFDYYGYATTKMSLLHGLKSIHLQYNADYQYFIPSMLYGPNYHTDGRDLHFLYDIMRKIYRYTISGKKIILWGDGNEKREILYIDDAVDMIINCLENDTYGVLNLNSGHSFSIKEIVSEICSLLNVDESVISYDKSKGMGKREKLLCNDKLNNVLDKEFTPLGDGLRNTMEWVINHYEDL
jgi:GDP-L-fucose synthase